MNKIFNPHNFIKLADKLIPFLSLVTISLTIIGIYWALILSPADYQQHNAVKIMYIHVPAAWMSLFIYSFMALSSVCYLIWQNNLCDILSRKSALIGTNFTFITLITGAIWGKPIWGTWWVWDARLTSFLILFFFYLAYIAIDLTTIKKKSTAYSLAVFSVVGFINVPIVKFSVNFWHSLHQPAGIFRLSGSSIHSSMIKPLIIMSFSCLFYFFLLLLIRTKSEIVNLKIKRLQHKYFY